VPVCSYVVVPRPGKAASVASDLARIDGCEVAPAENAEMLLLVTSTASLDEDAALRREVEALGGIQALLMTFGEVDPDTSEADPLAKRSPADQRTTNEVGQP